MRWMVRALVALLLWPIGAEAASGPRWTAPQLAEFADVVVTGTITQMSTGWDREVDSIYTYVTLDVDDVLKGDISPGEITIKQLGGAASGYVLSVVDQPLFTVGERVLLYLEVRPRDGTLYTSALWQGKWTVARDAHKGEVAVRHAPDAHGGTEEQQSLAVVRSQTAAAARVTAWDTRREHTHIVTDLSDVRRESAGFTLLGPFRYQHLPTVDIQSGGQPGLPGGGFAQLQSAMQRWNSVGTSFRYSLGSTSAAPRCASELLNNGRVTVTFMDPCGEMSNSGGTLAMGGSYFVAGEGGSNNGQPFDRALEGFVINNDSPTALEYLTNPGCFEDVQTHELGHVLGLNHSLDPGALMYAYIDSGCSSGARGLRADDIAGVRFIYGGMTPTTLMPPAVPPTDVQVIVQTTNVQVTWSDPPGDSTAAVTSYQVDFRSGHTDNGPLVASVRQPGSSIVVAVPPGVSGAFSVTVRGVNAAGLGPASPRQDFTLGATPTSCTAAPAAPTGLTGSVSNGYARVQWSPSVGATRYVVQAGSATGAADLFAQTDLGPSTSAGASVPVGFRAWIRVFAVNSCGVSAPADYLLQ